MALLGQGFFANPDREAMHPATPQGSTPPDCLIRLCRTYPTYSLKAEIDGKAGHADGLAITVHLANSMDEKTCLAALLAAGCEEDTISCKAVSRPRY